MGRNLPSIDQWRRSPGYKSLKLTLIGIAILLPFLIRWALTRLPGEITIAGGPPGGRFRPLSEALAEEIRKKLNVKVHTIQHTNGSLENLSLLRERKVDFALYQTWTTEILKKFDPQTLREAGLTDEKTETSRVEFVANLYSQPVHFIVRKDAGIREPKDLAGKRVNLGHHLSGQYAMSLLLLDHLGLDKNSIEPKYLGLPDLKEAFLTGTLDAAIITLGEGSPIFLDLFDTGECDILSVPYTEALAAKQPPIVQYRIPAGRYRYKSRTAPANVIYTVALGVQLLTREDVHKGLVAEVTKILLSQEFLKKNQLGELFAKGRSFARERPEFPVHPGADRVYNPELRPLLDPGFVEATEGIRSFIFSTLIAGYFGVRWVRRTRTKQREHKLERFIQRLVDIERRQLSLGNNPEGEDVEILQKQLDEIILLRQEALGNFTAHELSEDRATDCFLEMCYGLSDTLNAKISRQRLDKQLGRLTEAMDKQKSSVS